MSSTSDTPPEDFFNDPSQSIPNNSNKRRRSPTGDDMGETAGDGGAPKAKRIACIICRKRKLKCDGSKPSCSTCTRLNHNCAYDEVRRKSGPKRGYVKALEERLKQVETLLKTQDPADKASEAPATSFVTASGVRRIPGQNLDLEIPGPTIAFTTDRDSDRWAIQGESPQPGMDDMNFNNNINMAMTIDDSTFTWEMIGLGLDEPLPPQDSIDELHQIYFDKIHPSVPMVHKYRYLAAMNLAPNQRPPVCLRYAMWTLACSVTEKFSDLKEHFYQRARKYVEQDYLKGHGEHMISVGHAQTHILLASYEFKMMYFPRAWMSTGSAVRLSQMMGLHRLDGAGLDVKQCLPGPRDWTEREERRRTFWMAFCEDRYASIGTGWPMTIDEKDILTNLPASEEAFERSKPERTSTLPESLSPSGAATLSSFAGVVLMACLFGRNLVHLHRPDADDRDNDLEGEFWKRHRHMDNILLNTSLSLPSHLKLPNGLNNPNIVFTNMNIHTSTICLHQAAIYKADKNRLPSTVSKNSKLRCISAANEIAGIMRMISHIDLTSMNSFISFCLYVAARVFVQYLKSRPDDTSTGDSLRFLLTAMNAMKAKNPLTESFLVQLDVDLESLGLKNPKYKYFTQISKTTNGSPNGATPPTSGMPATKSTSLSGGGVIDQCNFMKVVDYDTESTAMRDHTNNGFNTDLGDTSAEDSGISGMSTASNPNIDVFSSSYPSEEHWLPIGSTNTGVHPTAMQGLILGQGPGPQYERVLNIHGHMSGYGRSESSNNIDLEFSEPGISDRPTPTSTTPSDGRSNLQPGHAQSGHSRSGHSSFETSPVASNQQNSDQRAQHGFFSNGSDIDFATGGATTGMASRSNNGNNNNSFAMPETSGGRDFNVPGGWEMNQGLTPVGEGVFRELMGMGPMDMGWDGTG